MAIVYFETRVMKITLLISTVNIQKCMDRRHSHGTLSESCYTEMFCHEINIQAPDNVYPDVSTTKPITIENTPPVNSNIL